MTTKIFQSDEDGAGTMIRHGGLVAVPTETVYGLAGNGLDPSAVSEIYEVKGRPSIKPLSLMIPCKEDMIRYCDPVPSDAFFLADRFWPGPLTIVLQSRDSVPEIVRAGGTTVGLRCPDSDPTLRALREAEVPFAAPSANPSGESSPVTPEEVLHYFDGKIAGVIDGGRCTMGFESTIIAMDRLPYRILRQGALPYEAIADALTERMTVIGITGPSGCGKTFASELILQMFDHGDCCAVDCDALYHTLLENDFSLNEEILEEFPTAYVPATVSGSQRLSHVDRKKLSEIVFSDPDSLKNLNKITHKHIISALLSELRRHAMNGGRVFLIDASELIGSEAERLCTSTVSVLSSDAKRISRITARDGISASDAERRIRAQHDQNYYRQHTSFSVFNDGSPADFRSSLEQVIKTITANNV